MICDEIYFIVSETDFDNDIYEMDDGIDTMVKLRQFPPTWN